MGAGAGMTDNAEDIVKGYKLGDGLKTLDGPFWNIRCESGCAEVAVAKALNQYWVKRERFQRAPDIGKIEVRLRSNHEWDLKIKLNESPDNYYVLVTGRAPVFAVRGWLPGVEGKKEIHKKDHGNRGVPAYFVEQQYLRDLDELIEILKHDDYGANDGSDGRYVERRQQPDAGDDQSAPSP